MQQSAIPSTFQLLDREIYYRRTHGRNPWKGTTTGKGAWAGDERIRNPEHQHDFGRNLHVLKVTKDATLLDMSKVASVHFVKSLCCSQEDKDAVDRAFPLRNDQVYRNNTYEDDSKICKVLDKHGKSLGLDGFGSTVEIASIMSQQCPHYPEVYLSCPLDHFTVLSTSKSGDRGLEMYQRHARDLKRQRARGVQYRQITRAIPISFE